jgi:uncharacterized SAM-binding protein YcdF (DUF218 family)
VRSILIVLIVRSILIVLIVHSILSSLMQRFTRVPHCTILKTCP